MGTISKKLADAVIAGKFAEDRPVLIVKYTNAWGGESYGLICEGEPLDKYRESDFVQNPTIYWRREETKND